MSASLAELRLRIDALRDIAALGAELDARSEFDVRAFCALTARRLELARRWPTPPDTASCGPAAQPLLAELQRLRDEILDCDARILRRARQLQAALRRRLQSPPGDGIRSRLELSA